MDAVRLEKLRQAVFERLTLGEHRSSLRESLITRLDADVADDLLDAAVGRIVSDRQAGVFDAFARKLRKREFGRRYLIGKILAGFLGVPAAIGTVGSLIGGGELVIYFVPLALSLFIMIVIDTKMRNRTMAAERAVDLLVGPDPAPVI